jgi:hypothetical protein
MLAEEVAKARSYGLFSTNSRAVGDAKGRPVSGPAAGVAPGEDRPGLNRGSPSPEAQAFEDFFNDRSLNRPPEKDKSAKGKWGEWSFVGLGETVSSEATEQVGLPPACVWGAVLTSGSLSAAKAAHRRDSEKQRSGRHEADGSVSRLRTGVDAVPGAATERRGAAEDTRAGRSELATEDEPDPSRDPPGSRGPGLLQRGCDRVVKFWEPTLNAKLPGRMLDFSGRFVARAGETLGEMPAFLSFLPRKMLARWERRRDDGNGHGRGDDL